MSKPTTGILTLSRFVIQPQHTLHRIYIDFNFPSALHRQQSECLHHLLLHTDCLFWRRLYDQQRSDIHHQGVISSLHQSTKRHCHQLHRWGRAPLTHFTISSPLLTHGPWHQFVAIYVEWTTPNITNGLLTKYVVRRDEEVVYEGSNTSISLTDLSPYTQYRVSVSACTGERTFITLTVC